MGRRQKEREPVFFFRVPQPQRRTRLFSELFKNSSVGPSYTAFRTGRRRQNVENWVRFNPKRGESVVAPKNTYFILDTKFNGDVIFAIRHDLI